MSAWKKAKLFEVASIFNGKTPSKSEQRQEGHPVLKIRDVNPLGGFRGRFESFVTPEFADKFVNKQVRNGDTLILNAAHNAEYVASKIYRAQPPTFGSLATGEWLIIRPNDGVLHPDFVYHWVNSAETVHILRQLVSGIHLYPKDVARVGISIPRFSEQRRIAAVLDQAATLRAKRREALARLDELIQSIFLDMFGHPVSNPYGIPLTRLSEVGRLDRGVSKHRPRNAPHLLGGPYPLVQTGEVANCDGYIRSYTKTYSERGLRQSRMWPAGTLCITIAANIAKTGILIFDACFPDSVVGFTSEDSATVEFVRSWLSFLQSSLEENAPKSAQRNINLATLRSLEVPLPSVELRREFAQRIEGVERLKASYRTHLTELDVLFSSLQYRAFRGEL